MSARQMFEKEFWSILWIYLFIYLLGIMIFKAYNMVHKLYTLHISAFASVSLFNLFKMFTNFAL